MHPACICRRRAGAATSTSARLLGMEAEIGTIGEGKVADLVAGEANPLSGVAATCDISFVMQSGHAGAR